MPETRPKPPRMRSQEEYELAERLVRMGMSSTEIAKVTGIPRNTIKAWRKFGRTRPRGPNRSDAEYEEAKRLIAWGMNDCEIARLMNIPRGTIRDWRVRGRKGYSGSVSPCPGCDDRTLDEPVYAYLLGLYLGDGCISEHPRGVYRLRITLDMKYPRIIDECARAVEIVRGDSTRAGRVAKVGCIEISAYWKHWPCVFPQHGPGPKFKRKIELVAWQQQIVDQHPDRLLRGLVHSDGSRDLNVVNGKSYPRYSFANNSADIQQIFCRACEILGVRWTQPYWQTIAISGRPDVETLDEFIGPKR